MIQGPLKLTFFHSGCVLSPTYFIVFGRDVFSFSNKTSFGVGSPGFAKR